MTRAWFEDDLPIEDYEPVRLEKGDSYGVPGSNTYPEYQRPIGFMRRKPRVRVKAWTQPIPPENL